MKQLLRIVLALSLVAGLFVVSVGASSAVNSPTDINDPALEAERDAAALAACRAARDGVSGTAARQEACKSASSAAYKAKKAEQLAIIRGGAPTTSTPNNYPTDINDPILKQERADAAVAACRSAREGVSGTAARKEACKTAAIAANKAMRAEQLAIINGGAPDPAPTATTKPKPPTSTTKPPTTSSTVGGGGGGGGNGGGGGGAPLNSPVKPSWPTSSSKQFTFFNQTMTQTANSYAEPNTSGPGNWRSPTNYSNGRVYMKYTVLNKKNNEKFGAQVCMWRHTSAQRNKFETCSNNKLLTFTGTGTFYRDLGAPATWWKLNGVWDWSQTPSIVRVMHKVTRNGVSYLPMDKRCGSFCVPGNASAMVPLDIKVEVVVVAPGYRLKKPSGWNCPSDWYCG